MLRQLACSSLDQFLASHIQTLQGHRQPVYVTAKRDVDARPRVTSLHCIGYVNITAISIERHLTGVLAEVISL